jgi:hypothetical protein
MQPKARATTVAEFDALAQQELDKRKTKVAAQPLAKRAFTWPAATGLPTESVAAKPPAAQAPGAARAPKPRPHPIASDDWFSKLWR